jgi:putative oxidoreductase
MRILSAHYPLLPTGLLLLRVGMGIAFIFHGYNKLVGGPDTWEGLGGNMALLGITFAPTFWGFMAAATEVFGGLLLALGLFFRPVCVLLAFTMLVALLSHLAKGDPFPVYSNALKSGITFVALFFTGPGRASLDAYFFGHRAQREEEGRRQAA